MTEPERLARLRLARTDGVGPIVFRQLLSRFGGAAEAIAALPGLARAGGRAVVQSVPSRAEAEREFSELIRRGGRFVFEAEPDYPPLLALLSDAPPVISVLGDPRHLAVRAVALVGGRNASANGQMVAERLAEDLARAGLVVVSGLARGIDTAAHRGALRGGVTVGVVAGGIDIAYPPENEALQHEIAESGALISEAPLGTAPAARHFPRRNRLIAGLALGVVVVEAAPRSGSLITARLAQETGREIFAVPGSPLDPRARGSNDLIRQGGHLTEAAEDVLANLPDHPLRQGIARSPMFAHGPTPGMAEPPPAWIEPAESPAVMERARAAVLALISPAPTPVDEIIRRCQFSAAAVAAALLELELAGRTETLPGNRVCLLAGPGREDR